MVTSTWPHRFCNGACSENGLVSSGNKKKLINLTTILFKPTTIYIRFIDS
jgi:hypothetical protein